MQGLNPLVGAQYSNRGFRVQITFGQLFTRNNVITETGRTFLYFCTVNGTLIIQETTVLGYILFTKIWNEAK